MATDLKLWGRFLPFCYSSACAVAEIIVTGNGLIAKIMIVIVDESPKGAKNSAKVRKGAKKVSSKILAYAVFFSIEYQSIQ